LPSQDLVARFRPFLEDLVTSDLSSKTIRKQVDNLWALGGEIIRDLNENPSLRRKSIEQILDDRIDEEGGHSSMPWNRKSRYNDPSTPPAGDSTVSSARSGAEPLKSLTDSAAEAFFFVPAKPPMTTPDV